MVTHSAGEHVEGDDVLVGVLREDDGGILVGRAADLGDGGVAGPLRVGGGVHLLDAPALLPLELVPLGVRDPHRVRHPARQRPLERRPLRVPRERRLQPRRTGRTGLVSYCQPNSAVTAAMGDGTGSTIEGGYLPG